MTSIEAQIKEALQAYFQAIKLQCSAEPPALRPHFEALDHLKVALPADAHPRLRHFMEQKSYEKALALLETFS